ncbi:MAG: replication factor C small subunit, partial [Natronomonas sp.]
PVLTNRGIERIESVVGDGEGFDAPEDGLEILTFDERGDFEYVSPSHVFGTETDELVRIQTRDGNEMTTTPEHRLLTISSDGLQWTEGENLDAGDRIVRPRQAPLPDGDAELDWIDTLDGDRIMVQVTDEFADHHDIPKHEDYVGYMREVFESVRNDESDDDIASRTGNPPKTVQAYRRQAAEIDFEMPSTTCSLSDLRTLDVSRSTLRDNVEAIQYVTPTNRRSRPVKPPWELSSELATFLGLSLSEARIDRSRIKFYNIDEDLLDQFAETARTVFGVEPAEGVQKGVPYRVISNRTIVHVIRQCFAIFDDSDTVGSRMVSAPAPARRAFLRSVFDAEGHVTESGIVELSQKDGDVLTLLSYLLAAEGIPTRRKTKRKRATNGSAERREYHVLDISGAPALAQFEERVGFSIDEKAARVARNARRQGNPNHDTIPAQGAVDRLCDALYLPKGDLLTDALNPETPGREIYLEDVESVLDAAERAVETAQETMGTIDRLAIEIARIQALPARWVGERARLEPGGVRLDLSAKTGVRSDRLLENPDSRRMPRRGRATALLERDDSAWTTPRVKRIQSILQSSIDRLGVPYNHVAEGTDLRVTDVINLLENDDHELTTTTRFGTVAERVRELTSGMCSESVLEDMRTLGVLLRSNLYFDEVTSVERVTDQRRVYDLTVPETRNYVAGDVPTVMHNTTSALAIAREIYGEDWQENFLELNASDERGIDVVRDRIKSFARASFGGYDYRIIFLDEADALTSDAQSALRRTMEQFSDNTRFILSCNYSSQIIDPIQSRCAVFRFSPLGDEAVIEQIHRIAEAEEIEVTEDGIDALAYAADGDMRKAINGLQAAAVMGETVDEDVVFQITSTARPEEVHDMVRTALDGDFAAARSKLDTLLVDAGIAGGDIIDQLHRTVWEFELDDEAAVRVMERIGEADYRITAGADERIQLEALLASLALEGTS